MNFTNPSQLRDGMQAKVRLSQRDNRSGTAPEWDEPVVVTLYVERNHKNGKLATLALRERNDWAEYGENHYDSHYNEFLNENYRMQILEFWE